MGQGLRGVCKKLQTLSVTRPWGPLEKLMTGLTKRRQQRLSRLSRQEDGTISRSTRLGLGPCLACRRNPDFFWISLRITFFTSTTLRPLRCVSTIGKPRPSSTPWMAKSAKISQLGMAFQCGGEVELDRRSAAVYLCQASVFVLGVRSVLGSGLKVGSRGKRGVISEQGEGGLPRATLELHVYA